MPWPKGKSRKVQEATPAPSAAPAPRKTVKDLADMLERYKAMIGSAGRGLFSDCELDIYRVFAAHHNDTRAIAEIRPTGCSDRVFYEWELRFSRAFGKLSEAA